MLGVLRPAMMTFLLLTALTGVVYPLAVTGIAQVVFPHQANGSVIPGAEHSMGSELIGQYFDDPRYFWGRPSATTPPNDVLTSSGSNLGPTNPDLIKLVKERIAMVRRSHPERTGPIPADLVTASASGIDPHISPAAAEFQAERIARVRAMTVDDVRQLISANTEARTLGLLGEPRINVLRLNLALDRNR